MDKKLLRSKYKELRAQLTAQQIEQSSLDIANQLLQLDIWKKNFYHLFLSIEKQKEVQTDFVLHILQGKDKNVVISKSNFEDYSMSHQLLTDATKLSINKWGIPEPVEAGIIIKEEQLDVVFIPLLACDQKGNRIGYGKGFYDRFLRNCRSNTVKIGLSFFHPLEEAIEHSIDDVPLNMLVCPNEVFYFTNS